MQATLRTDTRSIPIPDDLRRALGLEGGETVSAEQLDEGVFLRRSGIEAEREIHGVPASGVPLVLTDEEMDQAVAQAIVDDFLREEYEPR